MKAGLLWMAFSWSTLWLTRDQLATMHYKNRMFQQAAEEFQNSNWKAAAHYRAGDFEQAESFYSPFHTPESEYNRGNCFVLLGRYQDAIQCYRNALEVRPNWIQAIENLSLAEARYEQLKQTGGDLGDQRVGADEIVYDKSHKAGEESEIDDSTTSTPESAQALWLRRVQTKPGDFLKAKFAYQLAIKTEGSP
ncbi:tetratricopeptide repeat protein [Luteolibacter pohnpeiensis]|uniref:Tetratricopeptide repeat protein n=1 Tax=Luteolibacter pohnpeiensis TaxID=454153 RepID=A0A934S542_9BACT|nr:tetratricopeptide repeat protein [Luteolibacter pohnpeiensis]MBK1880921.1 tetratricopeptide repeat protein [Luteolibacter pohnpeiensis]